MARGQVKKTSAPANFPVKIQEDQMVFALDIGTRSIIGMVGVIEEGRVKIIAIEREEHTERAMIDGQIENIEKVAALADRVKKRLESRLDMTLSRVCVAAAGRALRTKRADFEMELSGAQMIDDEVISRLEAGAISRAEEAFDAENEAEGDLRRFYLVGYTVCQYYLDQYMMSSLKDHRGRQVKVDLIATFLPSEVVESLYTTMNKIGLDVASLTLEPIAAINAAIPENLRLLNLVMVDIGAGTSDIAACTGGSVTGYTMATVAGDEITEALMKAYLVDFGTAETIKTRIDQEEQIVFSDILGFEHKVSRDDVFQSIQGTSELLCREIAQKILEVNGGPPSALFLAGGGSKLVRLQDGLAAALGMDANRVAVAGNYFQISAFSEEYDLNNPEYATPLGIAVSAGLNMINDSFRVILNGKPAKLFKSGSFTALNLLMMNGYGFRDIMGRSGLSVAVTVNGERRVFYGTASQPASLTINGKDGKLSQIIHAGDSIDFEAAVAGEPAHPCLGDLEGAASCQEITLNGKYAFMETPLKNGDVIVMRFGKIKEEKEQEAQKNPAERAGKDENFVPENLQKAVIKRETPVLETAAAGRGKMTVQQTEEGRISSEQEVVQETAPEAAEVRRPEDVPEAAAEMRSEAEPGVASERRSEAEPGTASEKKEMQAAPESAVKRESEKNVEVIPKIVPERKPEVIPEIVPERKPEVIPEIVPEKKPEVIPEIMPEKKPEVIPEIVPERKSEVIPEIVLERKSQAAPVTVPGESLEIAQEVMPEKKPETKRTPRPVQKKMLFYLNGLPLYLPRKADGQPYYLMDMIEYSGIDLKNPGGTVKLTVNGMMGMFQQELMERDAIEIRVEER